MDALTRGAAINLASNPSWQAELLHVQNLGVFSLQKSE